MNIYISLPLGCVSLCNTTRDIYTPICIYIYIQGYDTFVLITRYVALSDEIERVYPSVYLSLLDFSRFGLQKIRGDTGKL